MAIGNDGDENEVISFEVDFAQAARSDSEAASSSAMPVGRGTAPRWIAAVGALGALALLWILTSLTSSEVPPIVQIEAEPAEVALVVPTPPPTPTPTPTPTPAPDSPSFVDTRAASVARRQLASAVSDMSVLYLSDGEINRFALATGTSAELRSEATSLWGFSGGSLLRSESGLIYAVDPDALGLVHTASGMVRTAMMAPDPSEPGASFLASVSGTDPAQVVVLRLGVTLRPTNVAVPDGVRLRAVDTLGVLAYDPAVGSSLATREGFEFLSEGQILTASAGAWVEVRCQGPEDCSLVLVDRQGEGEEILPERFAIEENTYLISPDGRQVLRRTPEGFSEIYLADTGDVLFVSSAGMHDPAWSPDSSFVAWLDLDVEPQLRLMFPSSHDWISARLSILGATLPTEHALLVLAD